MQLLVTRTGKAALDVNLNPKDRPSGKKGKPGIYLEVFKPVGQTSAKIGGRDQTLPVFYDAKERRKDSMVGKLSLGELSALILGVKQFIDGGTERFAKFSQKVNNNERFRNLVFAHENRQVGIRATTSEQSGDRLTFVVLDKGKTGPDGKPVEYAASTNDIKELLGIVAKMEASRDLLIQFDLGMVKAPAKGYSRDAEYDDVPSDMGGASPDPY